MVTHIGIMNFTSFQKFPTFCSDTFDEELLPAFNADDARFTRSFSFSLPDDLLLALARPLCRVECQEWGRLFFILALPSLLSFALLKKEFVGASCSAAPLCLKGDVSENGVPSRDLLP